MLLESLILFFILTVRSMKRGLDYPMQIQLNCAVDRVITLSLGPSFLPDSWAILKRMGAKSNNVAFRMLSYNFAIGSLKKDT